MSVPVKKCTAHHVDLEKKTQFQIFVLKAPLSSNQPTNQPIPTFTKLKKKSVPHTKMQQVRRVIYTSCSLTRINKRLHSMPCKIMLLAPPSAEERNFDIDESSSIILLQLIKDSVEDVLNTSLLDVIPSYINKKNTSYIYQVKRVHKLLNGCYGYKANLNFKW